MLGLILCPQTVFLFFMPFENLFFNPTPPSKVSLFLTPRMPFLIGNPQLSEPPVIMNS